MTCETLYCSISTTPEFTIPPISDQDKAITTISTGDYIIGDSSNNILQGKSVNIEHDTINTANDNFADVIWSNGGNDYINSLGGADIINGGKGNDLLNGGKGYDTYYFTTGDGQDIITDVDESSISVKNIQYYCKNGQIIVNNVSLTGGVLDKTTGTYINNNPLNVGVTYNWSGVNGTNLIINYGASDSITIQNFNNGDLDILFNTSKIKDLTKIPDQLKKDKQSYADKVVSGEIVANADTGTPSLIYEDPQGKQWNVINCENTSKVTNAYGTTITGSVVDTAGNYILTEVGKNLKLTQSPVNYSKLVSNMKATASGQEVKTYDLAISSNIYIPTSSAGGSATLLKRLKLCA